MEKPYVFISYSTKDQEYADKVYKHLTANGLNVWIASHDIHGGEDFANEITNAVNGCDTFVFVMSKNSDDSPHCINELSLAFSGRKKIIPIRIEDFNLSKTSTYFLQRAQWVNAVESFESALDEVFAQINKREEETNFELGAVKKFKVEKINYEKIKPAKKQEQKEIGALHEHIYEEIVIPPTCLEQGYTLHRCECGEEYKDNFVPVRTEHEFKLAEKKEPTCINEGYEKYECIYCDATNIKKIKPLGHKYKVTEVKEATCFEEGFKTYECATCGNKKQEILPKVPHDFGDWILTKNPTCEEEGEETRQCKNCPKTESRKVKATGHTFSKWVTKTEPTCDKKGVIHRQCTVCGKIEEKATPKRNHEFTEWQNSKDGIHKERTCKHCGFVDKILTTEYLKEQQKKKKKCISILVSIVVSITILLLIIVPPINKKNKYEKAQTYMYEQNFKEAYNLFSDLGDYKDSASMKQRAGYMRDGKYGVIVKMDNLTMFTIPEGVTGIVDYAFRGCTLLTSVTIPDSVTSIGDNAFEDCHLLTSVVIGSNVTSIGDSAFRGCYRLTSVEIPNSVTSIGEYAFRGCYRLTNIEIPNNVTSIGYGAFRECTSLTSIEIPDSVTSIGDMAFENCESLKNITFNGTRAEWERISKGRDWDYAIKATYVTCSDGIVDI